MFLYRVRGTKGKIPTPPIPPPRPGNSGAYVGTFLKDSSGSAPVSQSITGLPFRPKALVLWGTVPNAENTWTDNVNSVLGITDGSTSYCAQATYQHAVNPTNCNRYAGNATLLTLYSAAGVKFAECTLTSLDSKGFTLNWTTNDTSPAIIHFLALGGPKLKGAKVVVWTLTTGSGTIAVTGAGFQPDLAIHITGCANNITTPWALQSIGAADAAGGQFAVGNSGGDNVSGYSIGYTISTETRCITIPGWGAIPTVSADAHHHSMDADGFTIHKDTAPGTDRQAASLCLKGGSYKVGTFAARSGTGDQSVTGVAFQPHAVLVFSGSCPGDPTATFHSKLQIGGMDGTRQAGSCHWYDGIGASPPAKRIARTDQVILIANTTPSQQDVAAYKSLDADGFSLTWSVHASSGLDLGYIAARVA